MIPHQAISERVMVPHTRFHPAHLVLIAPFTVPFTLSHHSRAAEVRRVHHLALRPVSALAERLDRFEVVLLHVPLDQTANVLHHEGLRLKLAEEPRELP